jgi:hypothetical protein
LDSKTKTNPQRVASDRQLPAAGSRASLFFLPSITDLIFILLLVAFSYGRLAPRLLWDADIGWHVRNGQDILATHAIPRVDSFSATMSGQPWYAWEWLYDLVMGWIHNHAALNGVVFLSALVISATLALVFRFTLRRGANIAFSLVFFVLCALVSSIHFLARPHVVGWLLTIGWFWVLETSRSARSKRRLLWLPLLMILWTNLHGGFLLGFVLLGIYLIGDLLQLLQCRTSEQHAVVRKSILTLGAITGLCAVASLVNPYGFKLHVHVYQYLTNRFFMQHIDEFRRPDLHAAPAQAFLLMIALAIVAIIVARGRLRWVEWLLMLFGLFSGMYAARNLPLASMLLMMVAAPLLSRVPEANDIRFARWRSLLDRVGARELQFRGHLWPLAAVALCFPISLHQGMGSHSMNAHFDPTRFPAEAVRVLQQRGVQQPIFSLDSWGGYFLYRRYPEEKVFIDDRHDFYGESYIREYLKVVHAERGWETVLDRWGVNLAVLPSKSNASDALRKSPNWRVSHQDNVAVTFERRM